MMSSSLTGSHFTSMGLPILMTDIAD
jgi:hypothetical protein